MTGKGREGLLNVNVGYSVEKKIVQPDDVTRAKSTAWLDLISPMTEWAGLKGDALKHKRDLLRIEQDETLIRLGQKMRERLAKRGLPAGPIPAKALIPFLEKASLEDPDLALLEAWANLGVSASVDYDVEVIRFLKILEEIGPREKSILEVLVGIGVGKWADRKVRSLAGLGFAIYDDQPPVRELLEAALQNSDVGVFETMKKFMPTGYPVMFTKVVKGLATATANRPDQIMENVFYAENAAGFELLKHNELVEDGYAGLSWNGSRGEQPIGVAWVTLTELGFAFVNRVLSVEAPK